MVSSLTALSTPPLQRDSKDSLIIIDQQRKHEVQNWMNTARLREGEKNIQ
jgi:hypothetical protein